MVKSYAYNVYSRIYRKKVKKRCVIKNSMTPCIMSNFSTFAYFADGGMLRNDAFEMSRSYNVK